MICMVPEGADDCSSLAGVVGANDDGGRFRTLVGDHDLRGSCSPEQNVTCESGQPDIDCCCVSMHGGGSVGCRPIKWAEQL